MPKATASLAPERLQVVIAMGERVEGELITADLELELSRCCEVSPHRVRGSFDDPLPGREVLAETDVLLTGWGCPTITAETIGRMPRLRAIVHAAGTVKTFIDPEVFETELLISSAAEANAIPVAEYTFAAVVMAAKRSFALRAQLRDHGRPRDLSQVPELGTYGLTIGVVSASRTGRLVIERLRTLDARVLVYDPYLSDAEAARLGVQRCELKTLFSESQIVTLHTPLLPETEGMVNAELLSAMADHSVLINTARGRLVDTAALAGECASGRLDAVLDVTDPEPLPVDSPLLNLDNVFVTPHIAGALGNEVARLGEFAVDEVRRLASGLPLQHAVHAADLARLA